MLSMSKRFDHNRYGMIGIQDQIEQITEASKGMRTFIDNKDSIVLGLVKVHESEVIDFVTEDQLLNQGIDATGKPIVPKYRSYTVFVKGLRGQITDHVTLKDTGDYHDSHYLTFGADEFDIDARDYKKGKLTAKYGTDILGLTPQNVDNTAELIRDETETELRKLIITE